MVEEATARHTRTIGSPARPYAAGALGLSTTYRPLGVSRGVDIAFEETPPTFEATLSPGERRLTGRLEGFGDIVFGFAISQCALMLTNAHGRADLSHPTAVLLYFGTFAILATLWLSYHRMLSSAFAPTPTDLGLAFAFLAFVSLLPYAMYAQTHEVETLASARVAVGEYTGIYAILSGLSSTIAFRSLRRGWFYVTSDERDRLWSRLLRSGILCTIMVISTALDVALGPTVSAFAFLLLVALRVARARFPHAPTAASLRIEVPL